MVRPISTRSLRTWLPVSWVLVILLSLVAGAAIRDGLAAQEDGGSAAGIVVDTGEGEPAYVVVAFDEPSMNAVELLRSADLDAVTVEFGGLGEAVCAILDTGCDVSTCRQRVCQTGDPESPFWQYWEQDAEGAWSWSVLGGSHADIEHGDIAAWVWTGVEPEMEPITWEELAERAGAPADVARGEVDLAPAVYASVGHEGDDPAVDRTGTLAAAGIVALIGVFGGWLVVRNRRMSRMDE